MKLQKKKRAEDLLALIFQQLESSVFFLDSEVAASAMAGLSAVAVVAVALAA